MTQYRIRVYKSPGRQLVKVRAFRARDDLEARRKGLTFLAFVHHRYRLSAFITSWAIDVLDTDTIGWRTVAMS